MEWPGGLAASILRVTLFAQVWKHGKERQLKGVNPLLYYGQALASLCFAVYNLLINSWVFAVTNPLGLAAALIGFNLFHTLPKASKSSSSDSAVAGTGFTG